MKSPSHSKIENECLTRILFYDDSTKRLRRDTRRAMLSEQGRFMLKTNLSRNFFLLCYWTTTAKASSNDFSLFLISIHSLNGFHRIVGTAIIFRLGWKRRGGLESNFMQWKSILHSLSSEQFFRVSLKLFWELFTTDNENQFVHLQLIWLFISIEITSNVYARNNSNFSGNPAD